MDFDKTSFSVDWFTPGEKYRPKRLSFPKSACISIDDLVNVSDSPLSFCFSPVDEAIPRPRTPYERACGWTNSAPPTPFVPSPREPYAMYDQDPKTCEESATGWRSLPSPGLLSIADDCASCGVDLDVSCLDALDEQLLATPVESFIDLCWTAAVQDDVNAPVLRRSTRSRARSFRGERERPPASPLARDYPGSFERTRPLAAKITLPLDTSHFVSSPLSCEFHDTFLTYQEKEKPLAYIMYADPEGRPRASPTLDRPMPRLLKKRELTHTPSVDAFATLKPPSTPRLKTSKSSHTLRVITDACASFARAGKKSSQVAP